jgi:hypothetical protein
MFCLRTASLTLRGTVKADAELIDHRGEEFLVRSLSELSPTITGSA